MKPLWQFCVLVLLLGSVLPCAAAPSLVDHYRKALVADPHNQTLRYHLGIALMNQGENRLALKAFRAAYPQRVGDPEINFNLALVYLRLADPDSALLYLDQALASGAAAQPEIYPLQNVYFNLVLLYQQQDQLDAALQLLQRLIGENPTNLDYVRVLGDYLLRLGRVDESMPVLADYLRQAPEDSEIREYAFATIFNRGIAAYAKQDFSAARDEFGRALQFVERSPLVIYYLALLDYQAESYSQVADRLPQAYVSLDADQKNSARSILYNTALSLKQNSEFAKAQQALEPLISVPVPRSKDLALLAGIQLESGAFGLARQGYIRLLQKDPGYGSAAEGIQAAEKGAFEALLHATGSAFAAEDLSAAQTYLRQAAEIYPENSRLRIYQARLARAKQESWRGLLKRAEGLEAQQQYVEALDLLRQGLSLAPTEPRLLRDEQRLVELLAERINVLYSQGMDLYARGEQHLARSSFEQLVQLSPEHQGGKDFLIKIDGELQQEAQRAVGAGEAALAHAELLEARQAFQRALTAWPAEVAAKQGVAQVEKIMTKRVAETLAQARRARTEGRLQAAAELLEAAQLKWPAAAIDTELVRIRNELQQRQAALAQLARTAILQRDFNQAAQVLAQADSLGPGVVDFTELKKQLELARAGEVKRLLDLARQKVAAGSFDAGLKSYRRVLDLEPENTEALAGLKRGRSELSVSIEQYLAEGLSAHQAGEIERARQAYRAALKLDPYRAEAVNGLRQLERAGRAGLSVMDSKYLYLMGIELYTEGEYNQAIAAWRQVLDHDPTHKKAQMNIDKAERKIRQIQERQSG